jgi:heme/copper-type cytochrome/quinol oxidase subunit 2
MVNMRSGKIMKKDHFYLFLIILLLIGIPLGIRAYDHSLKPQNLPPDTKEFTLTGNSQKGWILGEVQAYDILSVFKKEEGQTDPVLKVTKGDQVVLKLRSSDVTHGFAMKAFGIYISKGIDPGQTIYVKFKADKTGTFMFSCTVFCGDIHHSMKGTLVVSEVIPEVVTQ